MPRQVTSTEDDEPPATGVLGKKPGPSGDTPPSTNSPTSTGVVGKSLAPGGDAPRGDTPPPVTPPPAAEQTPSSALPPDATPPRASSAPPAGSWLPRNTRTATRSGGDAQPSAGVVGKKLGGVAPKVANIARPDARPGEVGKQLTSGATQGGKTPVTGKKLGVAAPKAASSNVVFRAPSSLSSQSQPAGRRLGGADTPSGIVRATGRQQESQSPARPTSVSPTRRLGGATLSRPAGSESSGRAARGWVGEPPKWQSMTRTVNTNPEDSAGTEGT
ncbi:hypothetical protein T484DRAFT_1894488 [Baffinella frigidus]|nr:hypothetical protein T484DRAFT_1894488 [Cryptophyta sp. CCMP2293]